MDFHHRHPHSMYYDKAVGDLSRYKLSKFFPLIPLLCCCFNLLTRQCTPLLFSNQQFNSHSFLLVVLFLLCRFGKAIICLIVDSSDWSSDFLIFSDSIHVSLLQCTLLEICELFTRMRWTLKPDVFQFPKCSRFLSFTFFQVTLLEAFLDPRFLKSLTCPK